MHFEVLVEDQSGKRALDILLQKIVGSHDTYRVIPYRGIGHVPRNLQTGTDPSKRLLLDQLPRLLRGYGRTFRHYPEDYRASVIVVCDLDERCLKEFRRELLDILTACHPRPETRFCIAVEECEAWLLGDLSAVVAAYPRGDANVLRRYRNDDICGTWELLADAVYRGGATALTRAGWQAIGREKAAWAEHIGGRAIWQDEAVAGAPEPRSGRWSEPVPTRQSAER